MRCPPQLLDALAESVGFAADQSESAAGLVHSMPTTSTLGVRRQDWRPPIGGAARRVLTARDGFPPRARAEKAGAMELIKALDAHGATPHFRSHQGSAR